MLTAISVCYKKYYCLLTPNAIATGAVFFIQGILCVSHGKHIELWNTNTWEKLSTFRGHGDRVEAVQLKIYDASKPTGMVLSGSKDQTVKYWDITRWKVCMEVAEKFAMFAMFTLYMQRGTVTVVVVAIIIIVIIISVVVVFVVVVVVCIFIHLFPVEASQSGRYLWAMSYPHAIVIVSTLCVELARIMSESMIFILTMSTQTEIVNQYNYMFCFHSIQSI